MLSKAEILRKALSVKYQMLEDEFYLNFILKINLYLTNVTVVIIFLFPLFQRSEYHLIGKVLCNTMCTQCHKTLFINKRIINNSVGNK